MVSLRAFNNILPLFLACLDLACFFDNGGPLSHTSADTDAPTTTSSTTTSSTTTAAPSTGPQVPDPTTGPGEDTGDPTTTTLDPDTGTTVDPTAPPLVECWDQGPAGWPLMGPQISTLLDQSPAFPTLSPDGLTLHYIAGDARRPFRSVRAGLFDPFPSGSQIAVWDIPGFVVSYPNVVLGGAELLISNDHDIYYALPSAEGPDEYDFPKILGETVNTADYNETVLTVTADARTLVVQRNDGPPIEPLPITWRFYQYERPVVGPGAPFYDTGDVTPYVEPLGLAVCPALSPDGLHLLFTSTDDKQLDVEDLTTLSIYYTRRPDRGAPWEAPQKIEGLHTGNSVPCASSLTADGCQLSYFSFLIGDDSGAPTTLYLAQRAP